MSPNPFHTGNMYSSRLRGSLISALRCSTSWRTLSRLRLHDSVYSSPWTFSQVRIYAFTLYCTHLIPSRCLLLDPPFPLQLVPLHFYGIAVHTQSPAAVPFTCETDPPLLHPGHCCRERYRILPHPLLPCVHPLFLRFFRTHVLHRLCRRFAPRRFRERDNPPWFRLTYTRSPGSVPTAQLRAGREPSHASGALPPGPGARGEEVEPQRVQGSDISRLAMARTWYAPRRARDDPRVSRRWLCFRICAPRAPHAWPRVPHCRRIQRVGVFLRTSHSAR